MAPRLTQVQRERIIGLRSSGCRIIDICRQMCITKKTVHFWLRRWEKSGTIEAHRRELYVRSTTAADDAAMVAAHSADPFLSTRTTSASYSISMDTVRRRLKEGAKKIHKEVRYQIEDLIAKVHDYIREEYELLKLMKPAKGLRHLAKISGRTAQATGLSQVAVREILSKQATRTTTKRQRPDKHHQPPKKPKQTDGSSEEDSSGGDENDGEHSTTEHVVETLVVKEEPEPYYDGPEVYVELAGVKTEPDACGDDRELADLTSVHMNTEPQNEREKTCSETVAALSAAKPHKGSIKQRNVEAPAASSAAPSGQVVTLVVKEEPETYNNDEPEVYVELAGVKTEPDACGDDRCSETVAALSAAKHHKGSIKQRNVEAPAASSAAPSGQLPLPPDQQLKVEYPLTNEQGFS